jgi:hypothetical protein
MNWSPASGIQVHPYWFEVVFSGSLFRLPPARMTFFMPVSAKMAGYDF